MEGMVSALITTVGAVLVAVLQQRTRSSTEAGSPGVKVPAALSAVVLGFSLLMLAFTVLADAVYPLVMAWLGAAVLSALLILASRSASDWMLFVAAVAVLLLLLTVTVIHLRGVPTFYTDAVKGLVGTEVAFILGCLLWRSRSSDGARG